MTVCKKLFGQPLPYQKYTCFDDKEAVLKAIDRYTSEYKPYKYEPDPDK